MKDLKDMTADELKVYLTAEGVAFDTKALKPELFKLATDHQNIGTSNGNNTPPPSAEYMALLGEAISHNKAIETFKDEFDLVGEVVKCVDTGNLTEQGFPQFRLTIIEKHSGTKMSYMFSTKQSSFTVPDMNKIDVISKKAVPSIATIVMGVYADGKQNKRVDKDGNETVEKVAALNVEFDHSLVATTMFQADGRKQRLRRGGRRGRGVQLADSEATNGLTIPASLT
jgi:hypothetical protein